MLKLDIPSFTGMPARTEDLVDQLGTINRNIQELESTAHRLKSELIRRGVGKYEGLTYYALVQHYDRAVIIPTLVREVLDPELLPSVTEIKPVDSVTVKRYGQNRL